VVITGGTSGIGEIAAERLAQMGARIVLIARDKSRGTRPWRGFTRGRQALATQSITPIWRAFLRRSAWPPKSPTRSRASMS
jgi:NAD(P)-dependent dehydrogenase (short-subunit alcohol dehydrogenase family)